MPDDERTASLPEDLRAPMAAYVTAIADDEMLVGHRDSEWTGLGPILEEDIAFSSMAQDELGHALVLYRLLEPLGGPDPDAMAFLRDAPDWRNARLAELPRGDYATSLVRQYLYDLAEAVRYDALAQGGWPPLAEAATKLRQEEKYHLIHGRTFLRRLSGATRDSRGRLQDALDELWPYALGLWEPPEGEARLVEAGLLAPSAELSERWMAAVGPFLSDIGLHAGLAQADGRWEPTVAAETGGRRGRHGPELAALLAAMQGLYRSDPEATW